VFVSRDLYHSECPASMDFSRPPRWLGSLPLGGGSLRMGRTATARRRRNRRRENHRYRTLERSIQNAGETAGHAYFTKRERVPCEDCNLRGDLSVDTSTPLPIGKIPLRPSRLSKWRPMRSAGCETCEGKGWIEIEIDLDTRDPYDLERAESRIALARVLKQRERQGLPRLGVSPSASAGSRAPSR